MKLTETTETYPPVTVTVFVVGDSGTGGDVVRRLEGSLLLGELV